MSAVECRDEAAAVSACVYQPRSITGDFMMDAIVLSFTLGTRIFSLNDETTCGRV